MLKRLNLTENFKKWRNELNSKIKEFLTFGMINVTKVAKQAKKHQNAAEIAIICLKILNFAF